MKTLTYIWRSMRPKQWTKNAVVLAPLIFAKKAQDPASLLLAAAATLLFCLAASGNYLINDLLDREQDRLHPTKCRRPIVCGQLPASTALAAALILVLLPLAAALALSARFAAYLLGYLILGVAYSVFLKNFVIIDVMSIALGFVLRVNAGAAVIDVPASHWLFLCTVLLALFLGFGKRRHELVILNDLATGHREILREYSPYFLDQMMSVVTASTVIVYSLYTISPEVAGKLGTPNLYLTIPFVLYGIFRYLYLIHLKEMGGSPSTILLTDRPLMINILLWAAAVSGILYNSHP